MSQDALWETPPKASPSRSASRGRGAKQPAEHRPVARILVDVSLAHLDRTFDYQVPRSLDEAAVPGCRVRVRFAGQLVDGFLVERAESSEHKGRLAFLERVVSSEPVLAGDLLAACRAVAQRYGGTLIDVVRLAVPPRHARTEREQRQANSSPDGPGDPGEATGWARYPRAGAFLAALRASRHARAVWQAMPGEDWPARLAELAAAAAVAGRGAVLVVPDYRDLSRLHAAVAESLGAGEVVALSADLGPAERYRRWLAVSRGEVRVVVGTRAAMFAPVADPGLFVVWDDGDDLHAEPRAPYPHVRDVLVTRAHLAGASLVVAGFARTAEAALLVESGWAHPIVADRAQLRDQAPRVTPSGEDFDVARDEAARAARLPAVAFEAARAALGGGHPVLVQVPRGGYLPGLACAQCRAPARCRRCAGPLAAQDSAGTTSPTCRWCGAPEAAFRCAECGSRRLRAVVVGARRTAEELGKAFAGATVRTSGGKETLAEVDHTPAVVVCTPGAEPVVAGGYGAALLLDGWALLGRQDLRAAEETLRRWMAAAALVRPARSGGRVIVGAEASLSVVQALVRWDPAWHAESELAERAELGFPPAMRMAGVEGTSDAVATLLDEVSLPASAEVLGPVPLTEPDDDGRAERERALVRVPRGDGRALASAMHAVSALRTARKEPEAVRIQLDPLELV